MEEAAVTKQLMWILWPAFLVAGATDGLFFSVFDPHDLHLFGEPVEVSRQAAYTIGFFCFWAMTAISGAMSVWLSSGTGVRL
jgi:hypothetical protein